MVGALGLAACGPALDSGGAGAPLGSLEDLPGTAPAAGSAASAASLPGKLLYVGDANIWLWERGSARRLTADRISRQPAWSPDGKQIAHVKIDVSSSDLWVMEANGGSPHQLTQSYNPLVSRNNWAWRPVWWPDQSRLLYLTEEGSNDLMLWQVGLDGKNRRPFLTVPDGDGGLDMPSMTPDGKRLALVSYRGPGLRSQVWTYALPSGPLRQLTETEEGAYDPTWSPDGTRIAYVVRSKGHHDLWVMRPDGSDARQVTSDGACRAPCWSPDGQWLAYVSGRDGTFDVWAMPAPELPAVSTTSGTPSPASAKAGAVRAAPAMRLTKGAQVDGVSGLSWTR